MTEDEILEAITDRKNQAQEQLSRVSSDNLGHFRNALYYADLTTLLGYVDYYKNAPNPTLALMEKHRLIVRPTVVGGWAAEVFARVYLNGRIEGHHQTYTEGRSIEEAVQKAAEKAALLER